MTEAEWLDSSNPELMLQFLDGKVSDRKLRLFICACCRRIWDQLRDERSQRAVETAERYADGTATSRELAAARTPALRAARGRGADPAWAAYWAVNGSAARTVWNGAAAAFEAEARSAALDARVGKGNESAAWNVGWNTGLKGQAALLREIVGNPFRPVRLDPLWLAWNDGAVRKLAQAIYGSRRLADLPLLADALEESGCDDAELLGHCRRPRGHVRGCFAVDLLAGLE
jgi:hypothetical protein